MGSRERYGAKRSYQTRQVLPLVAVVCDDTKTAVAYFNVLKHKVKDKVTVNVYPAPCYGATADEVFAFAKTKAESFSETSDKIFVLIDLDTNPDEAGLRHEASKNNLTLLLSKPCFEVWTLCHLQDTGEFFQDCNSVLRRVKEKWKEAFSTDFGNKAQADYEKLVELVESAIINCERRRKHTSQSWTEVWLAVKAILQ